MSPFFTRLAQMYLGPRAQRTRHTASQGDEDVLGAFSGVFLFPSCRVPELRVLEGACGGGRWWVHIRSGRQIVARWVNGMRYEVVSLSLVLNAQARCCRVTIADELMTIGDDSGQLQS